MLMQESLLGEALFSKDMQNTIDEGADESEETLSLCDLPLYSDQSADWDRDLSLDSYASNSISSSQQDYFEFFSQELHPSAATTGTTATTGFPPENIIFCGKLIPYKQLATSEIKDSSNIVEIKNETNDKKKRGFRLFGWKFSSSSRSSKRQVVSKNGTRSTTSLMHKKMYNTNKLGKGHIGFPTIFTTSSSSSGKAKWHLLLFGISRFPSVVEMRDIKNRQSRRRHSQPPPPPSPSSLSMFGFRDHDDMVNDRGWGLWGLIRALSCGGNHHSTAMATATVGGGTLLE